MKKRNLVAIVLVLCLSLGGSITAFASEMPKVPSPHVVAPPTEISPRFAYVMTASVGLSVSSSGAEYSVTINGISAVSHIAGTVTLYKGNRQIDSASINEYANSIDKGGTLKTDGPGSYKLIFTGTVYTNSGSEPLNLEITDSY